MISVLLSAFFAVLSAASAVYGWMAVHDNRLRLDKVESQLDSVQSSVGNVKASIGKKAREEVRDALVEADLDNEGGDSGMDVEKLLPMMMQLNGGGGSQQVQQQPDPVLKEDEEEEEKHDERERGIMDTIQKFDRD
jgi:hypothetical protein